MFCLFVEKNYYQKLMYMYQNHKNSKRKPGKLLDRRLKVVRVCGGKISLVKSRVEINYSITAVLGLGPHACVCV